MTQDNINQDQTEPMYKLSKISPVTVISCAYTMSSISASIQ